ncbi:MAG: hypothetical protein R8J94_21465 [Acidimicrobiia bacterium]|nr:hypothetical protein [Acidimicrobiia bacterium]
MSTPPRAEPPRSTVGQSNPSRTPGAKQGNRRDVAQRPRPESAAPIAELKRWWQLRVAARRDECEHHNYVGEGGFCSTCSME